MTSPFTEICRDADVGVYEGRTILHNYETAYYDAALSDSENFEQWVERGEKDAMVRAHEHWNAMLANYEALKDFEVHRGRKCEIWDAWY